MIVIRTKADLSNYLNDNANPVFVPTMGALHDAHLSLVEKAKEFSNNILVSIFVNPLQFNNEGDLKHYPRTEGEDIAKLEEQGLAKAVFIPSVDELYENNVDNFEVNINPKIGKVLCGAHRDGHFEGVCKVLMVFNDLIKPSNLILGAKDYQQLFVISRLFEEFNFNTEVIGAPLMREDDGLAMSSRNLRLTDNGRKIAPEIYRSLTNIASDKLTIESEAKRLTELGFEIDYFEVRNLSGKQNRIFIAAFIDGVRLIDNLEI